MSNPIWSSIRPLVPTVTDPGPDAHGTQWAQKAFGSWHPGLCQFVMADGAVKAVPVTINPTILGYLAQRDDGHPTPEP